MASRRRLMVQTRPAKRVGRLSLLSPSPVLTGTVYMALWIKARRVLLVSCWKQSELLHSGCLVHLLY